MRTLIIPDLHHRTDNADHWLTTQSYDRVVFLGDYFDDFHDTAADAAKTARWLRDRMDSTDAAVFLIGNHDLPYMFPDDAQHYCPGFTKPKAQAIREILQDKHWLRMQLVREEQGWILSHAGFHPFWIEEPGKDYLFDRCENAMQLARKHIADPLLGVGADRSGERVYGGPLWMDFDSLVPIPNMNQIVGHTPGPEVREKIAPNSENYCLDVRHGSVAAILSDGKLTILHRE